MKEALKARIQNYFLQWKVRDYNVWIPKSKIEELAKANGYLGDNAGRRLRELVEEGILEKMPDGKSTKYRYTF